MERGAYVRDAIGATALPVATGSLRLLMLSSVIGVTWPVATVDAAEAGPQAPAIATPHLDLGAGLGVGYKPSVQLRALYTFESGLVLGVEAELSLFLFFHSDLTGSAVLGWEFDWDGDPLRVNALVGLGIELLGAGNDSYVASVLRAGGGVEWKLRPWFGLGLEGGGFVFLDYLALYVTPPRPQAFGKLTVMFYYEVG